MHAFDLATQISPRGAGRYDVTLDDRWSIGGKLNGGYLLAIAARAALAEAGPGHEQPLATTGAFPAAAPPGPAVVSVEPLRVGRGTSMLRARMTDAEGTTTYLEALVTAGRLPDDDPLLPGPRPPALPPEADCPRAPADTGLFQVPMLAVVAERLDPATAGFAIGRPTGAGELRAWVRFDDGREPDPLALICLADALPPPSFDVPGLRYGWTPTLQCSVFVLAVPAPGPLRVRTVANGIGGGAMDETCDLWDSRGRRVAVAHQLAAVRPA